MSCISDSTQRLACNVWCIDNTIPHMRDHWLRQWQPPLHKKVFLCACPPAPPIKTQISLGCQYRLIGASRRCQWLHWFTELDLAWSMCFVRLTSMSQGACYSCGTSAHMQRCYTLYLGHLFFLARSKPVSCGAGRLVAILGCFDFLWLWSCSSIRWYFASLSQVDVSKHG